jgi:hypothetical protein
MMMMRLLEVKCHIFVGGVGVLTQEQERQIACHRLLSRPADCQDDDGANT